MSMMSSTAAKRMRRDTRPLRAQITRALSDAGHAAAEMRTDVTGHRACVRDGYRLISGAQGLYVEYESTVEQRRTLPYVALDAAHRDAREQYATALRAAGLAVEPLAGTTMLYVRCAEQPR